MPAQPRSLLVVLLASQSLLSPLNGADSLVDHVEDEIFEVSCGCCDVEDFSEVPGFLVFCEEGGEDLDVEFGGRERRWAIVGLELVA